MRDEITDCAVVYADLLGPALADGPMPELQIQKITDDAYMHTSFQQVEGYWLVDANGLVVLDEQDAYIIDTPWSQLDTVA